MNYTYVVIALVIGALVLAYKIGYDHGVVRTARDYLLKKMETRGDVWGDES